MEQTTNKKRIKSVWRFGKKYIPFFAIAELCILVSYAISVILPLNLRRLTDRVLYGGEHELLPEVINSYVILFVIATVFNMIYAFVWQYLHNHYVVDIKNELFRKTIFAKASFLSNMNSGDIMSRIDGDSEQFIHVIQRNLFHFVNSLILCVAVIWMVVKINLTIAVMLTVAAMLPIVLTRLCSRFTEKYAKETREISGTFTGRLFEILKGLREIRLACANWWMNCQVLNTLKKLIALGNKMRRVDFFVNKGIYLINLSVSILIYGFSAYLIIRGDLTIGLFLAVIEYIALLHKKFNWIMRIYLDWFARKVSIDRVNEIFEQPEETDDGIKITQIEKIEFQNVCFSYDDNNPVLEDVSFEIRKGQKLGIVGNSGVGKTTLMSLLLNFYTPNCGEIMINGISLDQIAPSSLRKLIGVVSQDILLFDESIRYNLNLGCSYSDAELWDVLETVGLYDLVLGLPQGLDTKISASSNNLSGGQKQRLMIARLLLKKAQFLILDEATSALDVETEEIILQAIQSTAPETTVLIISHRTQTIQNCDEVVVLNQHQIESIGTHKQLLEGSETYQALFGGKTA